MIGARIKAARLKAKLGIVETAKAAGISRIALWKIETGRTDSPRLTTLTSLAQALGCKVAAWL